MSLVSFSSLESSLLSPFVGSEVPSRAGMLLVVVVVVVGFGLGSWFAKLSMSKLGLELPSPPASVFGVRDPDQRPVDGDAAPLVLWRLFMYLELEPELMVRRTLPSELFQLL